MDERATLQRLAKEVEGLRARHTQIGSQLQQVDAVLSEHSVTEAVLQALVQQASAASTTHVSIGSGVGLPYMAGDSEGTALIDLGSNIFGERPWSDALAMTEQRRHDIQALRDELAEQAEQTERQLATGAQTFNRMASALEANASQAPPPSPQPPSSEPSTALLQEEVREPAAPKGRRRGMFGGELTLDD